MADLDNANKPMAPLEHFEKYIDSGKAIDWEEFVSIGCEARLARDISQWVLGKLALAVGKQYGANAIGKFSVEINVKESTLKYYRWVVSKFRKFERSNYLPFTAYKIAARTKNPHEWIKLAEDNDWTASQLEREIKGKETGIDVPPKPRLYLCSSCNAWIIKVQDESLCNCSLKSST